jgi:cytidylate kinase
MSVVLCFSGGIASGKTTLARAVGDRLSVPVASFGDFVRAAARDSGLPDDRATLQQLGEKLIADLGWEDFCRRVLSAAGWAPGAALIVDGVRHVAALENIRRVVTPTPVRLVFVVASREVRDRRAAVRGTELADADEHSTERDVHDALHQLADLRLDGTLDVADLEEEVLTANEAWARGG